MEAIITFKFIDLDGSVIKEEHTLGTPSMTSYTAVFNINAIEFYESDGTIRPQNIISFSGEGITGYLWDGTYHPVGTSYEFIDQYGSSSTITAVKYIADLTNTTWYVPSGWKCPSRFELTMYPDSSLTIDGEEYWAAFFGAERLVSPEGDISERTDEDFITPINFSGFPSSVLYTDYAFTISFGNNFYDATNSDLISWLTEYGTQLKVTDLTDTTWTVKAGWEAEAGYGEFNVAIKISKFSDFNAFYGSTQIYIGYGGWRDLDEFYTYTNKISTGWLDDEHSLNYGAISAFDNSETLYMRITDGTDTTNPKLIAWLSKWGKPMITDLTGYTVTVPAGWSASSGYGKFYVDCYNEYGEGNEFYIGYYDAMGMGQPVATANRAGIFTDSFPIYTPDNTSSFTVTFSGGTDTTNSSLIQWFYDNNATFEKTGGEEEPDTPEIPTAPHGEIYYKGDLVATIVEGETIVLHTKDFKFLGDIVIRNVGEVEETPTLISFTIDGITYQAEEGMTWGEWFNSEYNTDNYSYGNPNYTIRLDNVQITETDLIVANGTYTRVGGGVDD